MLVTAIKDHSLLRFKQGDEFTIQEVKYLKCGCVLFDVGIRHKGFNVHGTCEHGSEYCSEEIGWYASYMFTPTAEVTHAVREITAGIQGNSTAQRQSMESYTQGGRNTQWNHT